MGQRLNIEIIKNGEPLANSYYHWSAYTSSSLELAKKIIENKDKIQHQNDVIRAVRLLEVTGALLTTDEIEEAKKLADNEEFGAAVNRSDGLIAITSKGMESTRTWEEGRVEIDMGEETVNFNVVSFYNTKKEYMEYCDASEEDYNELPVKTMGLDAIPFDQFMLLSSDILELIDNNVYAIRSEDGEVLNFIE